MKTRTLLTAALSGLVAGPAATLALATPAQAVPDRGDMACDQTYVTHHQVDRSTVRLKFAGRSCKKTVQMQWIVQRGDKVVRQGAVGCRKGTVCRKSVLVHDPKRVQKWAAFTYLFTIEESYGGDVDRWRH